ncbi:ras association domain-containing protein 4 isoform X1 [Metopolophium dirhodum]|uniref:ras association domain-containing protein 4 isoform X1 n=1 Tax=Metopolophium dirhodum TaxID=44670 RepID=UPI0029902AAD|nr:ras association domain-containing protein 4 isoform X1 [Metopolophium dirhodum]
MWKCHKCGKPVYFAERMQSLGYDWHPECLRCEECSKRLNPGQHAEHKGVPYCHVPCYGVLFGPQLYGHGTRVESHTSFGRVENKYPFGPNVERSELDEKLKMYNKYYEGRSGEIRSREVNGRPILEGALRIYWAVTDMIHLKEDDDQRIKNRILRENDVPLMKLQSKYVTSNSKNDQHQNGNNSLSKFNTLPNNLNQNVIKDDLSEFLKVEREVVDDEKVCSTKADIEALVPDKNDEYSENFESQLEKETADKCLLRSRSLDDDTSDNEYNDESLSDHQDEFVNNVKMRRKSGSTAIKRRTGRLNGKNRTKLKRRCSINGHFYNRETSFFTPPYGSQMSVWVTSLVTTPEVINLMLDKYKVDGKAYQFSLFLVFDNGERRKLLDDEYPLVVRLIQGPHEDVSRLYLMESRTTDEISCDVAQFLNFSLPECKAILAGYDAEEEKHIIAVQAKYEDMRRRIKQRMEQLKVRL